MSRQAEDFEEHSPQVLIRKGLRGLRVTRQRLNAGAEWRALGDRRHAPVLDQSRDSHGGPQIKDDAIRTGETEDFQSRCTRRAVGIAQSRRQIGAKHLEGDRRSERHQMVTREVASIDVANSPTSRRCLIGMSLSYALATRQRLRGWASATVSPSRIVVIKFPV